MTSPMVDVRGIQKSYGTTRVLDGVDFAVEPGSVFGLLGPNGAGKTTMIRILSTLALPDAGTATVAGHDVVRAAREVRRAISLTGQQVAVDELLTGAENMLLMARLGRLPSAVARRRVSDLLGQLALDEAAGRRVSTYSGGMRRKLDLAVSLISRPPVIFLDEPTTGLDPRSRQTMWDAVRGFVAEGVTFVLTTQYLEEADQLADRIAVLDEGRIVAEGTPADLKRRLGAERVELTFADAATCGRAVDALVHLHVEVDPARCAVSVPTDGSAADARGLLNRLQHSGIAVEKVAVHQPSLDDVFLSLTSR